MIFSLKKKELTRQTFFLTGRNLGLCRWIDPIWFWFSLEKLSNPGES